MLLQKWLVVNDTRKGYGGGIRTKGIFAITGNGTNLILLNNKAGRGGGIYLEGTENYLEGTEKVIFGEESSIIIMNNHASEYGGGICSVDTAISGSGRRLIIRNNSAAEKAAVCIISSKISSKVLLGNRLSMIVEDNNAGKEEWHTLGRRTTKRVLHTLLVVPCCQSRKE